MISVEGLSKAYGPKVLLRDISFRFPEGQRIALVGPNGAGKTTFLDILCGLDEADSGRVLLPQGLVVGYLPQEPNPQPHPTCLFECLSGATHLLGLQTKMENALARLETDYSEVAHTAFERAEQAFRDGGGYALEAKSRMILSGLGFTKEQFSADPNSLSGGWRMRLELAKIFINNPAVLVLDEPTNHLDLPSLVWVEDYLQSFPGTVIFVSHDRSLLNRLATMVLHLHAGNLESYKGNFDAFLEEREKRIELLASQKDQLRKRRETLERFVERFGAQATKAAQAQSRVKMIAKLKDLEDDIEIEGDAAEVSLKFPEPKPSGREVMSVVGGSIGYGTKVLSRGLKLEVGRGQRIAVIGANGIGKSTLLKTIAGEVPAIGGQFRLGHQVVLSYFAQNQLDQLDGSRTVLASVLDASENVTERTARSLLGSFLFRGDDVFKPVEVLSGGEKSRVGIARLLVSKGNFLLLDEPTNHLDMSSCEILANALSEFQGTVLYVSHDRDFINETCTHVFAMLPDGQSALFEGQLDDYKRLAEVSGFPNVLDPQAMVDNESAATGGKNAKAAAGRDPKATNAKEGPQGGRGSTGNKERQRAERRLAKLEESMTALTKRVESLEHEMTALDPLDYKAYAGLEKESRERRAELAAAEEEWLELSEQLS